MKIFTQFLFAVFIIFGASNSHAVKTKKQVISAKSTSNRNTKARNTTPKKCASKSVAVEKKPLIVLSHLSVEDDLIFNAEYFLNDLNEEHVSQDIEENYESLQIDEEEFCFGENTCEPESKEADDTFSCVIHYPIPLYAYPVLSIH